MSEHKDDLTAARRHAIGRAWRRFGTALALPDIKNIEATIWNGSAPWVCDTYYPRQAYRVKVRDVPRIAIFDIHLGRIVTFLPSETWIRGRAV